MEFIDLAAQQNKIRPAIEERIQTLLDHGQYIMGPEVYELEQKLCAFTGATYCITCASGTDALLMALMSWDVTYGDAIFVPAFTFFATAEMPTLLGATVVFVDINPQTFTICPNSLKKAILATQQQDPTIHPLPKEALTKKLTPKVIIPVDLFGQAADYSRIIAIAKEFKLYTLEDAAQSLGGTYKNQSTGNLGCDCAATSFFPAKPLGCYGDGGAIFTNDPIFTERLNSIRGHGKGSHKYENVRIGINGRLDTLQAAILLAKLDIFPQEILLRQNIAQWYMEELATLPHIICPYIHPTNLSAFAQFSIRILNGKRDAIALYLASKNIPTNIYYPKPLHTQKAFIHQGYSEKNFPVALECSKDILALPFHPYLSKNEVKLICKTLTEAFI